MKKILLGIIIGAFLATAVPVAAKELTKVVKATVRTDYKVELDGNKVELKNAPLAYNGSSYLPVKEIASLVGKEVTFKDGVIKLETPIVDPVAELEKLNKDLRSVQENLKISEKKLADADSGVIEVSQEQRVKMVEIIKAFQDGVDYYENKIAELLVRYPELAKK